MSKPLVFAILAAAFVPLSARGGEAVCDYGLQADIRLDGNAVELRSDAGVYRLDGDRLSFNGSERPLTTAQHGAVADYRRGLVRLVPAASAVAVDGAMLGLEAMSLTITALGNGCDGLHRYERRSTQLSEMIHARFNGRELLRGSLGDDADDDALDAEIEDLAEQAAADVTGSIASLVFTALVNPARLEARADAIERLVERRIEPTAAALEARAKPLCAEFARLDALETRIGIDAIQPQPGARNGKRGFAFTF